MIGLATPPLYGRESKLEGRCVLAVAVSTGPPARRACSPCPGHSGGHHPGGARHTGGNGVADFLSRTVLVGFLSGVGVQVALGELHGLLGIEKGGHGVIRQLLFTFEHLPQRISDA